MGQVVLSHFLPAVTQAPLSQRSPGLQVVQVSPLEPQAAEVSPGRQMPLLQQPGQLSQVFAGSAQIPLVQVSPALHATQAAPWAPHWVFVTVLTQVPSSAQQPSGHVVALQAAVQVPPAQVSPLLHAIQVAPFVPQASLRLPGWQTLLPSTQPWLQAP